MNMSGTTDMIHIYSQNVRKNYVLVDSLLETQKDLYDILFIQEPPWNFIRFAPSTTASGGDEVVDAPIHPDWTQVVRFPEQTPRVMCFIHSRLSRLRFALRRDIVDHRNIQLLFFFNRGRCQFCHIQVHLSRKLHFRGDATSEPYKPTFHSSHLSRNTSYGSTAILQIFCLPRRRYSYSTQSSMTEFLLSVSQH